MKLEHVLELVKAGFDKDEIMKMVDSGEEVTPEDKPEDKPEEPEEKPEPEPDPKPEPEKKQDPYAAYVQAMQKTMDEMRETLKKIQAANVRGTELPENTKEEPADILGKAIF